MFLPYQTLMLDLPILMHDQISLALIAAFSLMQSCWTWQQINLYDCLKFSVVKPHHPHSVLRDKHEYEYLL